MASNVLQQLCMGVTFQKQPRVSRDRIEKLAAAPSSLPSTKLKGKPEKVQNRIRTHHGIGVWADDIPAVVTDFEQLETRYQCSKQLVSNIVACGYETPTPVQMITIPAMLERREVLVSAPTGSGKTAAFVIPLVHLLGEPSTDGFRAVVVCPTRELAKQTYREVVRLAEGTGLRTYVLTKTSNAQKRFSSDMAKSLDIMVTTPNRLVWLLKETKLTLGRVQHLIIDESDRLFEAGKSGFRDQLVKIYEACDSSKLKRAMFSATSSKDLDKWCRLHLDSVVIVAVGAKNSATKQVDQKLLFVGTENGKLFQIRQILRAGVRPPVLVFVESKAAAKELYSHLVLDGLNVDVIHSDRTISDRDSIMEQFRLGKIWILICTELMGRGIDFKGVQLVINYDFPQSAASYIHRIGRTGRAGRSGEAITFFMESDAPKLREIVQIIRKAGCDVPDYMLKLRTKHLKNKLQPKAKTKLKEKTIETDRSAKLKRLKTSKIGLKGSKKMEQKKSKATLKKDRNPGTNSDKQ
ncbi:probable ATP-dependent RNA helicase DDX52 [Galendromus occidentalis]|uniref:Probable ATP-dependent RNA helicase DDX52 n=1 Tax=Galendromus occidentalis TaxID=34638 RepID=A0AAJ7L4J0_9ACAR|nr:probable ATP-dependent RNA helicase DDX52 [Galendromus occidentalis]